MKKIRNGLFCAWRIASGYSCSERHGRLHRLNFSKLRLLLVQWAPCPVGGHNGNKDAGMLRMVRIFSFTLLLMAAVSGCGAKGDLYLEEAPKKASQTEEAETAAPAADTTAADSEAEEKDTDKIETDKKDSDKKDKPAE